MSKLISQYLDLKLNDQTQSWILKEFGKVTHRSWNFRQGSLLPSSGRTYQGLWFRANTNRKLHNWNILENLPSAMSFGNIVTLACNFRMRTWFYHYQHYWIETILQTGKKGLKLSWVSVNENCCRFRNIGESASSLRWSKNWNWRMYCAECSKQKTTVPESVLRTHNPWRLKKLWQ